MFTGLVASFPQDYSTCDFVVVRTCTGVYVHVVIEKETCLHDLLIRIYFHESQR